ncbi:MAG: ABC transporter substrate-binding protein [Dorea sp.]|nr:ABC transporter substrate-binding protein [Dorea sp.]
MRKRIFALLLAAAMVLGLAACASSGQNDEKKSDEKVSGESSSEGAEDMTFDEFKEAAKGSTVTFYGWGGDEVLNQWLDDVFAPNMKEKYDITMERVPMDIDQVLSQLSGEIQAGEEDGSIDMIWINGENFQSAKENNMLYGPFVEKLPNFEEYIDTESEDVTLDFAYPIDGYEAPYGKAQMVMIADTAVTPDMPKNTDELLEFAKNNKGKVTYPALPDFTGSVFVRNVIYEICGYEQFLDMEADKETVKKAVEPALEYLRKLNPYLWNEGKTFPDSSTTVDNMFADGELVLNMTYDAFGTSVKIADGTYTETTQSFQFDKGTIGNTNFMAIAANSGNKAGAMVAINEMMSPEIQADRYDKMKVLPVVDYNKLSDEQKEAFDKVDLGKGNIPQDELLSKRLPEMPAQLVPVIEEIWLEEVVGK